MADLNHEHLKKLTEAKSELSTLSETPVAAGELPNLSRKMEALVAELKHYAATEEQWKKERATLAPLEKKLKEAMDKLRPRLAALNAARAKISNEAVEGYKLTIPMSQTLFKLPAFAKANKAINDCMKELEGAKDTYSVKLGEDGRLDI